MLHAFLDSSRPWVFGLNKPEAVKKELPKCPSMRFLWASAYHALPGKRNETWDCAVYAFAALEDYAGFNKPNDMLQRLANDLLSDEP
jgi:phage terminase large subunit GpA-like protein